jgi:CS domain
LPYTWRQELGEVDVVVPVPLGTRGKDLQVVMEKKKLSVGLKGKDKILDGVLCKDIKVEDSTWTLRTCFCSRSLCRALIPILEDNQAVLIHLEKLNQQEWWENVLTHHPKIDTKKIEPPNGKLSDLDGETR